MSSFKVPDLGGASDVEVIEILVGVGDEVEIEQPLVVLETDKASMEIPSEAAGVVELLHVTVGDKISEGDILVDIEVADSTETKQGDSHPVMESNGIGNTDTRVSETSIPSTADGDTLPAASEDNALPATLEDSGSSDKEGPLTTIAIPDLGGVNDVEVIEISVSVGDRVELEDTLIVLESDKATMDIPSPIAGTVQRILLAMGDKVNEGDPLIELVSKGAGADSLPNEAAQPVLGSSTPDSASNHSPAQSEHAREGTNGEGRSDAGSVNSESISHVSSTSDRGAQSANDNDADNTEVHAGPAVRMLARDLGVTLSQVPATGRRKRITKDDVHRFVKLRMSSPQQGAVSLPLPPEIDHSQFGEIALQPLNGIKRATAKAMTIASLNVPQVTQFDYADITDLENFRKTWNDGRSADTPKISMVPIVLKALAHLLARHPNFKASLSQDGQSLIMKQYCHIGVAVNTPKGLLVPVIRDVDKKGIVDIASELQLKAEQARAGKLSPSDMQGGCFSVSSLGGIGGTAFTPIVNPPEVAILGLSVASMQPHWDGNTFVPRLQLPMSLSYDHRVIDGAEAAVFCRDLAVLLNDIRRLLF